MRRVKAEYPASNENDWARGCDKCKFGIVSAPPLTGVASLYMERMAQALDKSLTFCSCNAGERYRAALLNRRQMLIEEARKDTRMADAAHKNTHPDIQATQRLMHAAYEAAPPPTIHADGRAEEAERVMA